MSRLLHHGSCVFASAFGFLEATVVVYLRAAAGLLPGYRGTLSDVVRLSQQSPTIGELPPSLLTLEAFREAATLLMFWPHSIRDTDVLFLIPEPWFAPVWFPLVVSALALVAILLTRANPVDS